MEESPFDLRSVSFGSWSYLVAFGFQAVGHPVWAFTYYATPALKTSKKNLWLSYCQN